MIELNKITKIFENFNCHSDDYKGAMYINIYGSLPKAYFIYLDDNCNLTYRSGSQSLNTVKEIKNRIDEFKLLNNLLELSEKDENISVFCYSLNEWMIVSRYERLNFLFTITKSDENDGLGRYYVVVYTHHKIEDVLECIGNCFVKNEKHSRIDFGIAAIDCSNSLYTAWYDYDYQEIDIDKNYNDDIPYNKICNLVSDEGNAELILFYGEPGTGKSSFIKHLMSKYPEKDFVFIDGALLSNSSQERLMSYFLENKDTIFILEDCEKVLLDRDKNYNPVMSLLLNLTDGIISDVLGIKLICTFNTALSNIDKALLRKGRLSLKYEFKKLAKEKVRKILDDDTINEDMTLADIYNIDDENDYSKKQTKKIGF